MLVWVAGCSDKAFVEVVSIKSCFYVWTSRTLQKINKSLIHFDVSLDNLFSVIEYYKVEIYCTKLKHKIEKF